LFRNKAIPDAGAQIAVAWAAFARERGVRQGMAAVQERETAE
jgi:hypothetical protein